MSELPAVRILKQPAEVASLAPLTEFVLETAAAASVPEDDFWKLELVLEEILMNVFRHGYPPGARGEVEIHTGVMAPGRIAVEVRDWGIAFDPLTAAPPPNLSERLEDRTPGGLGVFLTQHLSPDCSYVRVDGQNRFAFSFPQNN